MDTATDQELYDLDLKAAERANSIFQNYDMVSEGVQSLRRLPIFGSFVSFSYETYRNHKNKVYLIADQFAEAKKEGNKEKRKQAIIRTLGFAGETIGYHVLAMSINAGFGSLFKGADFSDEDEDDVRSLVRSWDRNASMIFLNRGDDKHNMSYISGSSIVPSSTYYNAVNALFNDNFTATEKVSEATVEMLDEFLGMDIGTQVILEAANIKNLETGKTLYESEAAVTIWDKITSSAGHAFKAIQPSSFKQWERFLNSFSEAKAELHYGGRLNPIEESVALFGGIRVTNLNIPQSIKFNAYRHSSIIQALNYPYKKAGKNKSSKLEELIERGVGIVDANIIVNKLYGEDQEKAKKYAAERFPAAMEALIRDYQFALRRGVPEAEVIDSFKSAQMSNQIISMIKKGDTSFQSYLDAKKEVSKSRKRSRKKK